MAKSKRKDQINPIETIGKKVLILGEVGSGKTALTAKIVQELMLLIEPKEITVVDMAPEVIGEIGGKLSDFLGLSLELRYLSPAKVYAPRTMSDSRRQVIEYAKRNRDAIEPLLDEFLKKPTKVLIVNDITLYLHLGRLEKIVDCMRLTDTFVANAYCGAKLKEDFGAGISTREKQMVEELATYTDYLVELS